MNINNAQTLIQNTCKKHQTEEIDTSSLSDHMTLNLAQVIEEIEENINDRDFYYDVLSLMDFHHCQYNSAIFNEVYNIISLINQNYNNSQIATTLKLHPNHVELIQYLLCDKALADYGTSPRTCWLSNSGKAIFNLMERYKKLSEYNQLKNQLI